MCTPEVLDLPASPDEDRAAKPGVVGTLRTVQLCGFLLGKSMYGVVTEENSYIRGEKWKYISYLGDKN